PSQPPAELKPGELRGTLDVNPGAYSIIRRAMLADVEDSDGTGRHAAVDGMRICGKTGTAQVKRGGRLVRYDTWFVSFAPLESPRYVVVVLVEGGASGGTTCAPVAGRIYEEILKIESGTQAPIEPYYVRK
ncbi:MAG: hypothetical protein K9N48_08925, partial [Verrucomicrobia bacterium]|nr:hypothetical protein [Verrucomicrobiota bacterium]